MEEFDRFDFAEQNSFLVIIKAERFDRIEHFHLFHTSLVQSLISLILFNGSVLGWDLAPDSETNSFAFSLAEEPLKSVFDLPKKGTNRAQTACVSFPSLIFDKWESEKNEELIVAKARCCRKRSLNVTLQFGVLGNFCINWQKMVAVLQHRVFETIQSSVERVPGTLRLRREGTLENEQTQSTGSFIRHWLAVSLINLWICTPFARA